MSNLDTVKKLSELERKYENCICVEFEGDKKSTFIKVEAILSHQKIKMKSEMNEDGKQ